MTGKAVTPVTGVILAGGRGTRMGGLDKGLIEYQGRRLIEHVIAAFAPQVDELLINANRNAEAYRAFACPVIADTLPDYPGPLAGMLAGLARASHECVVFAPCDTPAIPDDLVKRFMQVMQQTDSMASYAHDGKHAHPACVLLRKKTLTLLETYLANGQRKVGAWLREIDAIPVDFSGQRSAFANINSPSDLDE